MFKEQVSVYSGSGHVKKINSDMKLVTCLITLFIIDVNTSSD